MQGTQTTVFGEDLDESYRLETTGRVIRPFKQLVGQILRAGSKKAEYRLTLSGDGLRTRMVDAANVIMIDATVHPSAFDTYRVDGEVSVGVSGRIFGSLLQHARYGVSTDDVVTLHGDTAHMESEVSRDVGDVPVTFTEREALIDTNSIREEPNLPELELPNEIDLPPRTFIELIDAFDGEHVEIEASDSLNLHYDGDVSGTDIQVDIPVDGDGESSLFSQDYLERIAKALHVGKVDDMTLRHGDEFPIKVDFEREDTYRGTIMLAPRVKKD